MTNPTFDWTIIWKWYHFKFFWILVGVGILLRIVVAQRLERGSWRKANVFAVTASVVSSACATWLPILPLFFGFLLSVAIGPEAASRILIATPLIAVSLGIQIALVDVALLRLVLRSSAPQLSLLLAADLLVASIALALVLAWAYAHPIQVIA